MRKIGIRLAATLVALCLTTTCAFAQTADDSTAQTDTAQGASVRNMVKSDTSNKADADEGTKTAEGDKTPGNGNGAKTEEKTSAAEDTANTEDDFVAAEENDATTETEKIDDTAKAEADDTTVEEKTDDTADASDEAEADEDADAEESDEADDEESEDAPAKPSASAKARNIINSLELEPREPTGDEEIDEMVEEILTEIITEDMDTYEQVKACYDYLTGNMKYNWSSGRYYTNVAGNSINQLFREYGKITGYGALALSTNKGQCNDYASGFILMTRALGIDSYLANGRTLSGGRYIQHYWVEVEIDGTRYVFDPQLEQSLARYGKPAYSVFCKTYNEVGGRYVYYNRTAV